MSLLGAAFFQTARWMSRRNGESLAQVVHEKLEEAAESSGGMPLAGWRRILESRPGWRRLKEDSYQFRTGERLELKKGSSAEELLVRMTAIEVKPLGEGLPPEAQGALLEEAADAAAAWWRKNVEGPGR
ncbi:MAG: hypothetical protein HYZ90_00560 [Candidatus Omnitrophica bacterium]|nr:hypothetical protein [Candidatus Omnitrophota bacterium]